MRTHRLIIPAASWICLLVAAVAIAWAQTRKAGPKEMSTTLIGQSSPVNQGPDCGDAIQIPMRGE